MRILQINCPLEIKRIMQDIKVDPYGIKIMLPKAVHFLIKMGPLSNIAANILKQEMLSLGADAAIARGSLTGSVRKTDCLLMGDLAQFNRLNEKLKLQPFGLNQLAGNLKLALENYQCDKFNLDLGKYKLNLRVGKTLVMGILNVTPDSFSADGLYYFSAGQILDYAERLVEDGADLIDVGGESSRPGAKSVSVKEELSRVMPVIKLLAKKLRIPISIDTCKPEVADQALDNGAVIVNDICGLRNRKLAKAVAKHNAGIVIMHMKGNPRTMQKKPRYTCLIDDIINNLDAAIKSGQEYGIKKEKIIIDPGIGFGKTAEHNLEILQKLRDFRVLGRPILVGTSRKSFIGKILNAGPEDRLLGSVSSSVIAAKNGAKIIRVHDVKETKQALKVFDEIEKQ